MAAAFLLALTAVFVVSLGGRDQLLVARLSERLGRGGGLLAVSALAISDKCRLIIGTSPPINY